MNLTGTAVTAGGLDHSESGREYFRVDGSIPEKVHGVVRASLTLRCFCRVQAKKSHRCEVPCQSSDPRIPF